MKTTATELNPFSLMMEPELVLRNHGALPAIARLAPPQAAPLGQAADPYTKEALAARAAFDAAIDAEDFEANADSYLAELNGGLRFLQRCSRRAGVLGR